MKLKYIIPLIISLFIYESLGQNKKSKLDLMQGVWENIRNSDSEKAITIIKGMNSLNFVYNTFTDELNFPLNESLEGFQNNDFGNLNVLNVDSLKYDGLYYTIVDKNYIDENGWVRRPDYLTPKYFECDGEIMSINGGQLVEYRKIPKLPNEALKKLYYRGIKDNRNYIKEYLDIEVKEIIKDKSFIYSEPGNVTKIYLIKGDVVMVIEEKGKWLKVDYGADTPGWIKKEDTK